MVVTLWMRLILYLTKGSVQLCLCPQSRLCGLGLLEQKDWCLRRGYCGLR